MTGMAALGIDVFTIYDLAAPGNVGVYTASFTRLFLPIFSVFNVRFVLFWGSAYFSLL